MAVPGVGTVVIAHYNGYYFPAVVCDTYSNPTRPPGTSQPASPNHVHVVCLEPGTGVLGDLTEGTGNGQYSLPQYVARD